MHYNVNHFRYRLASPNNLVFSSGNSTSFPRGVHSSGSDISSSIGIYKTQRTQASFPTPQRKTGSQVTNSVLTLSA